ncbi:MAG: hypothetical protein RLY86_145 [Pseudomonadota bacterium]|jgi:hypothetical protein
MRADAMPLIVTGAALPLVPVNDQTSPLDLAIGRRLDRDLPLGPTRRPTQASSWPLSNVLLLRDAVGIVLRRRAARRGDPAALGFAYRRALAAIGDLELAASAPGLVATLRADLRACSDRADPTAMDAVWQSALDARGAGDGNSVA